MTLPRPSDIKTIDQLTDKGSTGAPDREWTISCHVDPGYVPKVVTLTSWSAYSFLQDAVGKAVREALEIEREAFGEPTK